MVGFVLASGFVLVMGLVLKWTGTSLAGTSMLLLAAGGGVGGATIAGICTFRHACFGRMVLDQNAWRPGLQMPQPIGNRDPAILQAAEVNSIITRERHAARIRTRMIVSRLAAATANRINNSMTVILGSIDIADNRGFGMDFHREIQGVRDGVEDTRQVCQRLLGLSVRGDTRSRRTNVESHVRDLESKLVEMVDLPTPPLPDATGGIRTQLPYLEGASSGSGFTTPHGGLDHSGDAVRPGTV